MVSLIVPVYNVKEYVDECLESIIRQTYSDIEVIVVDDGSTDGSGEKCDQYAEKDSRFKVIHQENRGLSEARNKALSVATGEYVMFVDSDDYVAPEYVSRLVEAIQAEDADMAIGSYYNAQQQSDGSVQLRDCTIFPEQRVMTGEDILPLRFGDLKVYFVVVWNKIYKRVLFDSEAQFPDGRLCEDAWISLDLYSKCKKVICLREPLYYYRLREGSIIHSPGVRWLKAQVEWLEREILYFSASPQKDNVFFPAKSYVSMISKNRDQFSQLKTEHTQYCWKECMDILLHDNRNNLRNKLKYHYYNLRYWMALHRKR